MASTRKLYPLTSVASATPLQSILCARGILSGAAASSNPSQRTTLSLSGLELLTRRPLPSRGWTCEGPCSELPSPGLAAVAFWRWFSFVASMSNRPRPDSVWPETPSTERSAELELDFSGVALVRTAGVDQFGWTRHPLGRRSPRWEERGHRGKIESGVFRVQLGPLVTSLRLGLDDERQDTEEHCHQQARSRDNVTPGSGVDAVLAEQAR